MLDYEDKKNIELKAILLGSSGVGKTNLINTCTGLKFDKCSRPTTTGTFSQKIITINGKNFTINLWDTAGQEKFRSLTKIFLKKADIVIYVYDITNRNSFEDLEEWINICKETVDNEFIGGVVGNKSDLYLSEEVKEDEGKKFADSKNFHFRLVSAKETPSSFIKFLEELIEEHKELFKNDVIENSTLTNSKISLKNKKGCC